MEINYKNKNFKQLDGVQKDIKINIGLIKYQNIVSKIVMFYNKLP